jgi:NAD(P)-dependent dehydrogenase (short-subunit alcohol dehydrogenase family)
MTANPVALVTGAAGGMASILVAGFRTAGYDVIAVDRAAADGVHALDVTDTAAVNVFAAGIERLDVLVNAAGVLRRHDEYEAEVFASVLDINLTGGLRLCTALKPALARAKGSIINVASMYAFFGAPHAPAYAASKGGVVQLTKSLAVAWAKDGIRVNAIAPGWIVTPMSENARADEARSRAIVERTPLGRWGTPDDVLGPVLFLASEAARFVTGVVLPVDGGYSVT